MIPRLPARSIRPHTRLPDQRKDVRSIQSQNRVSLAPRLKLNTYNCPRSFSTQQITSTDIGINDLLYFTPESPPEAAPQPLPLEVSVALVAPQQSLNVGAVARLMSLFGHTDLYISPNDGGIDAMRSGYILYDVFDDIPGQKPTVCLTMAPLLSPFSGYEPDAQHDELIKELSIAFDASVSSLKSGSNTSPIRALVRPLLDLPPLVRLMHLRAEKPIVCPPPLATTSDTAHAGNSSLAQTQALVSHQFGDEVYTDLQALLLPHVPQLLGFLDTRCFRLTDAPASEAHDGLPSDCVFSTGDVQVSSADRKGTRLYGSLRDICNIYSHITISLRAHKLWAITQATRAAHDPSFVPQPCPLPADAFVPMNLTFMRAGRASFKGAMSAEWHPHEATRHLQEWAEVFAGSSAEQSPFDEFLAATEHACRGADAASASGNNHPRKSVAKTAPEFHPARLHPGCAISTTAYYMATKRGVHVLQQAKLFNRLEELLPHFDMVVGTSALFKPLKSNKKLADTDDASSPVLRPWELADVLVSRRSHPHHMFIYDSHMYIL